MTKYCSDPPVHIAEQTIIVVNEILVSAQHYGGVMCLSGHKTPVAVVLRSVRHAHVLLTNEVEIDLAKRISEFANEPSLSAFEVTL